MKSLAAFAGMLALCLFGCDAEPAYADAGPWGVVVAHPGGSVIAIRESVLAARAHHWRVVMPPEIGWASADTMWTGAGRVYIDPDAVLLFHEAEICATGYRYGDPRHCVRSEVGNDLSRQIIPRCVLKLVDARNGYAGPWLTKVTGAEVLLACKDDGTIHPLHTLQQ